MNDSQMGLGKISRAERDWLAYDKVQENQRPVASLADQS
jgi:hypothetical protein